MTDVVMQIYANKVVICNICLHIFSNLQHIFVCYAKHIELFKMTNEIFKNIRISLGLDQTEFGSVIGLSRGMVSFIERGKRPVSRSTEAKIQLLLSNQLRQVEGRSFNSLGNIFEELNDGTFLVTVDLIPFEAHAKYFSAESEHDEDWQKVQFRVEKICRNKYLGFRVKGESMFNGGYYDSMGGDCLLGIEIGRHHWKDDFYKDDAQYGWVIITKQNILHKDIIGMNDETGEITCHSRNSLPEYSDFQLDLNNVNQIFKIVKRQ